MTGWRCTAGDAIASLMMMLLMAVMFGVVLWLLPEQAEPAPQDCVQYPLEYRGLPGCDPDSGPGTDL